MSAFLIEGGHTLSGEIAVGGAKNSALILVASCLLAKDTSVITNVPDISDVRCMVEFLNVIGARTTFRGGVVTVDATGDLSHVAPYAYVKEMRASIQVMGPLVARLARARVSQPGGCEIGTRPIDYHIRGLERMGAKVREDHGYIDIDGSGLAGAEVHLDFPSVGATENLMAAASTASGTTIIRNAAREPEIIDQQNLLNSMGARIRGAGTGSVRIDGVKALHGVSDYAVIPDRIEAATLVAAVAMAGGEVALRGVIPEHFESVLAKFAEAGLGLHTFDDTVVVSRRARLSCASVRSMPYPGFPTDMQPQMMAALTIAQGTSHIEENVFSSRFKHVGELMRMGAQIQVDGKLAIVEGVPALSGAAVEGSDLRGTAALVIAGLAAAGTTTVQGIEHLDRGYDGLERKLRSVGARVTRMTVSPGHETEADLALTAV